jgi:hypothetical protein
MLDRAARERFREVVREYNARAPSRRMPHLELLRDGRDIAGEWCQFTMGSIVLLEAARNPIFTPGEDAPPTVMDVIEAYWLLQPRHIDDAVWIVDEHDVLGKYVSRYANGLGNRTRLKMCDDMAAWLAELVAALPSSAQQGDNSAVDRRADWYMDVLDLMGAEYGWECNYVMWQLSWVRNVRLRESLFARRSGREVVETREGELTELMKMAASAALGEKDG